MFDTTKKIIGTELYNWAKNELFRHIGEEKGTISVSPLSGVGSTSLRFLLTFNDGNSKQQFVIKRYQIQGQPFGESKSQAQREYNALLHLKSVSSNLWSAPKPIAFSEEYASLIISFCPGCNVNDLFWNVIKWPFLFSDKKQRIKTIINHIALIIKDLQAIVDCAALFPKSSPCLSGKFFHELIDSLREKGVDGKMLLDVQKKVENKLDAILAPKNRSLQHTDLYFNNIIFDKGHYYILDFPNACYGSRYWDISHMIVSLEDYKIFRNVSAKAIDEFKESFLGHFSIDASLLRAMNLLHYCFSFNIRVNNIRLGYKKIFMNDASKFYKNRIRSILDGWK